MCLWFKWFTIHFSIFGFQIFGLLVVCPLFGMTLLEAQGVFYWIGKCYWNTFSATGTPHSFIEGLSTKRVQLLRGIMGGLVLVCYEWGLGE